MAHTVYPATEPASFNLLVVHGMQEHADRYHAFASFMSQHGGNVITFNLPGHGEGQHNPNQLGDFGSEGLHSVLPMIREHFARFDNTLPNVLFGHSMGSAIALRYAQLHPHLDQLILSGVPYRNAHLYQLAYHTARIEKRIKGPNSTSLLEKQTARFNDFFAPVRTPFDWLSLNPHNVDAYIADPHCGYPIAIAYFEQMADLMRMAFSPHEISKIKADLSVLLLWGEQDPCTSFGKSSARLATQLRQQGIHHVETCHYPQLRHEILQEDRRFEIYADILRHIQQYTHTT